MRSSVSPRTSSARPTTASTASWVAHPDLIPVARAEFDAVLGDRPNQVDRQRDDVHVTARDLLDIRSAGGEVTLAGVRANIAITVRYLDSWLRGIGAAAIDNLMEDAATAEISRSQLWQWIHQDHVTAEGETVHAGSSSSACCARCSPNCRRRRATSSPRRRSVFRTVTLQEEFPTFLTVPAYTRYLVEQPAERAAAEHAVTVAA